MDKTSFKDKAVAWVENRTSGEIKANFEGFEKPVAFTSKNSDKEIRPDFSFVSKGGGRHYTEIVVKQDDSKNLITRWKLLSTMAKMKNGKLFLLAPRGHKMFAQRIIEDYNIPASIQSI